MRAAIHFDWVLHSKGDVSPSESTIVVKLIKGLSTLLNPVRKAYPISYLDFERLFVSICKGQKFQNLSFIKQHFISMLMLAFSSFTRFEEIQFLKIEQIVLIDSDFTLNFFKGKLIMRFVIPEIFGI